MNDKEIFKAAIGKWGIDKQLDMVLEECSELQKAVCKLKRNGHADGELLKLAEEAADVQIMLNQLEVIISEMGFPNWSGLKRQKQKLAMINLLKKVCENEKSSAN